MIILFCVDSFSLVGCCEWITSWPFLWDFSWPLDITSFCRQRGCSACNARIARDRSQREGWQRAKHSWGGQRGWKPAAWKAFAGKVRHVTWVKNSANANISYLCCCGEGTGQCFGGWVNQWEVTFFKNNILLHHTGEMSQRKHEMCPRPKACQTN